MAGADHLSPVIAVSPGFVTLWIWKEVDRIESTRLGTVVVGASTFGALLAAAAGTPVRDRSLESYISPPSDYVWLYARAIVGAVLGMLGGFACLRLLYNRSSP